MRFTEAFALAEHEIVAIAGGSDRMTALYRLAAETADDNAHAIVCGTTLFKPPPDDAAYPIVLADDTETLVEATSRILRNDAIVVASAGHASKGRLLAVLPELPMAFATIPGVTRVLVEADGSRGLPFKAPGDDEPVIPTAATLVIVVAGMSTEGAPLDDAHVHRPERVSALTGATAGEPVTEDIIARTLAHRSGGRKGVAAGCRFAVMLDQVDHANIEAARRIAGLLTAAGVERVVLAGGATDSQVIEAIA